MIKKIVDWFSKNSDDEVNIPVISSSQKFELFYADTVIGYLEVDLEGWKFYYSEHFKTQNELSHITGFSDLNKVYTSPTLWPFFKIRIPGLAQPRVQKTLKKYGIEENDEVALLKRFGKKSISNPYLLEPVH